MKKFLFLLPALCFLLGSCGKDTPTPLSLAEYYPVREDDDSKWGFIDRNGEIVLENEFKNRPSVAINGVFYVEEKRGYTLYKMGKEPKAFCDDLYTAGFYNEGIIPVSKEGERIKLIDDDGKTVATLKPINGKEIVECRPIAFKGLLVVKDEEGNYGAVDTKGKTVIRPQYEELTDFYTGNAIAMKRVNGENKVIILDNKGKEVYRLKKDQDPMFWSFIDGVLPVREDSRYYFVNTKGAYTKLPKKVNGCGDFNSKYFAFKNDEGDWGVMTIDEKDPEIIVKAKYDEIILLPGDKFLVKTDGDYLVLNKKGEKEFKFDDDFRYVYYIPGSKFAFLGKDKDGMYIPLDDKGEPIDKKLEFEDVYLDISGMTIRSDYSSGKY